MDYFKLLIICIEGRRRNFTLCLFHRCVYQSVDNLSNREKVAGSIPVTDVDLGREVRTYTVYISGLDNFSNREKDVGSNPTTVLQEPKRLLRKSFFCFILNIDV